MSANTTPRVVLTGASRGLGLATLKLLLERYSARVATLSRSYPEALKEVVAKYGQDRVLVVQGDISKPEDNAKVVKSAVDTFGGIDSVILNAGSLEPIGQSLRLGPWISRLTVVQEDWRTSRWTHWFHSYKPISSQQSTSCRQHYPIYANERSADESWSYRLGHRQMDM